MYPGMFVNIFSEENQQQDVDETLSDLELSENEEVMNELEK